VQGFLLGLASGTTCLAFCAPALIPFIMHEGQTVRQNLVTVIKFLGGRMGGYLIFGLLAWATGSLLAGAAGYDGLLIGVAYVGLSVLLLAVVPSRERGLSSVAGLPCCR
jgi:sulfite exporter TauE/SafE